MIKNAILGCILLASCAPGSKYSAAKDKPPVAIVYPYSSVYKSAGAVAIIDSTAKKW